MTGLDEYEKKIFTTRDLEEEELKRLIDEISNFATVSPDGFVRITNIDNSKITDKERILTVLSVRYLLNNLQVKIGRQTPVEADVTLYELSQILRKPQKSISARVSELKEDNTIEIIHKGVYRIKPYAIDGLIAILNQVKKEVK
jgi:hypothetical protein